MATSTRQKTFDDVSEGETFTFSKPAITTTQLVMYAGASGDYNRIHYDHYFALEAGLGGVIGHGMLTMGMLAQAVTDWMGPGPMIRDIRSRFVSPVRPDDSVTFLAKVTALDATTSECSVELHGQVGEKSVIRGSAIVGWPRV